MAETPFPLFCIRAFTRKCVVTETLGVQRQGLVGLGAERFLGLNRKAAKLIKHQRKSSTYSYGNLWINNSGHIMGPLKHGVPETLMRVVTDVDLKALPSSIGK
jgi:hypothetical protein